MFNALYTLLALFLVFTELMHVCNLILAHMYSMLSDFPLNPGVTKWYESYVDCRMLA
jgi:hypothetical protein